MLPLTFTQELLSVGTPEMAGVTTSSATVKDLTAVQPFAPVTVTVYVPAGSPEMSSVTAVLDYWKV